MYLFWQSNRRFQETVCILKGDLKRPKEDEDFSLSFAVASWLIPGLTAYLSGSQTLSIENLGYILHTKDGPSQLMLAVAQCMHRVH